MSERTLTGVIRTCYGFGERENNCPNPPGGKWSPYFCPECDEARMAHLDRQFREIEEKWNAR